MSFVKRTISNLTQRLRDVDAARVVFWVCIVAWGVRLAFLSFPWRVFNLETQVDNPELVYAGAEFVHTNDWAERWGMVETRTPKESVPWMMAHLIWAGLMPGVGPIAYALSLIYSVIAALALMGAAGRIYDARSHADGAPASADSLKPSPRGALLAALAVSLSPLLLNYSTLLFDSMQSAMFASLSVYFLSDRRWNPISLLLGGISLGLLYVAGDASEPVALALVVGCLPGIVAPLFQSELSLIKRLLRVALLPVCGYGAALFVAWIFLHWSRYAGSPLMERLLDPAGLKADWSVKPAQGWGTLKGDWFRQMMELDPLIEWLLAASAVFLFRSRALGLPKKIALAVLLIPVFVLLYFATPRVSDRSLFSVILFGVLALPLMLLSPREGVVPKGSPAQNFAPLGLPGLCIASALILFYYTRWSALSIMPRQTFSAWPVLLLTFLAAPLFVFRERFSAFLKLGALVGGVIFSLGVASAFLTKNAEYRAIAHTSLHPQRTKIDYGILMADLRPYKEIKGDLRRAFHSFGTIWPLFPGYLYDAPEFSPAEVHRRLKDAELEWIAGFGFDLFSRFAYEAPDPTVKALPPPGTPETPLKVKPDRSIGGDVFYSPGYNRGLELRPVGSRGGRITEAAATITLPTHCKEPMLTTFGLEWGSVTPNVPITPPLVAKLKLQIEVEGNIIASLDTMIFPKVPDGNWALGRTTFYETYMTPIMATKPEMDFRLLARLELPVDPTLKGEPNYAYCPPVSCYIRRPYITGRPYPLTVISGFASLLAADETMDLYQNFDNKLSMLALARAGLGAQGKSVGAHWKTALWTGKRENELVFAGSYADVTKCVMEINGKPILEFVPQKEDGLWEQDGISLRMKYMGDNMGSHALFGLRLPDGFSPPNTPIEIRVLVLNGKDGQSWFGVRGLTDATKLPQF